MSKTIKPEALGQALQEELTVYHRDVVDRVNEAGRVAAEKLKRQTKATAPKASGSFRRHIAIAEETDRATGATVFTWHVKKPDHRLTHLLVHGHATRNGGRVKGNPFLQNALDAVLPEYEKAVEEEVKQ